MVAVYRNKYIVHTDSAAPVRSAMRHNLSHAQPLCGRSQADTYNTRWGEPAIESMGGSYRLEGRPLRTQPA